MRIWSAGLALALAFGACADATPVCRAGRAPAFLPAALHESSGLAVSRRHAGVLWSHNDSGNGAQLFAIDTTGRLIGVLAVDGARNQDWEDIALAPCDTGDCLYIADTGDNAERRNQVVIYRIPEPDPTDDRTATARAITVRYPAGPRDVEALFVLGDSVLFLVTKGRSTPVELYRVAMEGGRATLVQQLSDGPTAVLDQVTGADALGDIVAVRSYARLQFYRWSGNRLVPLLDGAGVDLLPLGEPQGEAVALAADGTVLLTSEAGPGGAPGPLTAIRCDVPALTGG